MFVTGGRRHCGERADAGHGAGRVVDVNCGHLWFAFYLLSPQRQGPTGV